MTQEIEIFSSTYSGEGIIDLEQDISECLNSVYNPKLAEIPADDYGLMGGSFHVSVVWRADE